jgi:hypothetical protein
VGGRGLDGDLPALPGARRNAEAVENDGEETGGDLLARGDHGVVFALLEQRVGLRAPADELVGLAGHRGDHHSDVEPFADLPFHMGGDVLDPLDGGDGGAAELHDEAGAGTAGHAATRLQVLRVKAHLMSPARGSAHEKAAGMAGRGLGGA